MKKKKEKKKEDAEWGGFEPCSPHYKNSYLSIKPTSVMQTTADNSLHNSAVVLSYKTKDKVGNFTTKDHLPQKDILLTGRFWYDTYSV